jgi:uncharacterized damage-inducible protein DinB
MTGEDGQKTHLLRALRAGREALLWKLEGLSERDVRWPVVPTGTNLLGLVKHVASVEAGYLGDVFGRPWPEPLPWFEDGAEPNADMWATADESRASVLGLYERVRAHSEATVAALPLDAPGVVPWWSPGKRDVTLHQVLVHLVAETSRHAGHADLVRELLDGAAGVREGGSNLPEQDEAWWRAYRARLEAGRGGRRAVTPQASACAAARPAARPLNRQPPRKVPSRAL